MTTAKLQMLARLVRVIEGLRERGYTDEADALESVKRKLLARIPKEATLQEVVVRTLHAVVEHDVTLDGRLIDVLAYLAKEHGVALSMHPVLLLTVALGGQGNPDREDPEKSAKLDALLSVMLGEAETYQGALYTIAVLARQHGLNETADAAVELLEEIRDKDAATQQAQAQAIEAAQLMRPEVSKDDDLGWVIKLMLTLASIAAVAAIATKLTGGLQDLIDGIDEVLGLVDLGSTK